MEFLSVDGVILSDKGLSAEKVDDMFFEWLDANNLSFIGIMDYGIEEGDDNE